MKTPKYFYRVTERGEPIPGTLARLNKKPETGKWVEVKSVCCTPESIECPECPPVVPEVELWGFDSNGGAVFITVNTYDADWILMDVSGTSRDISHGVKGDLGFPVVEGTTIPTIKKGIQWDFFFGMGNSFNYDHTLISTFKDGVLVQTFDKDLGSSHSNYIDITEDSIDEDFDAIVFQPYLIAEGAPTVINPYE